MEEQKNNTEEQFDIIWLLKYLYSKWTFIAKVTAGIVLLCIIVWASKPKIYTATASILPIEEEQGLLSGLSGNLGSLASLAGVNLSATSKSATIITSDLYPKVAESVPFLSYMIDVKLPWKEPKDTIMSFYEHRIADTIPTFGGLIFKYTLGLPGTIMKSVTDKPQVQHSDKTLPYVTLDKERENAIAQMQKMITVEEDPQYKTIEISVDAESPEQAAILATNVIEQIQNTATEHKTRRAKSILSFTEERYKEASAEYEDIYRRFSQYKDRHRDMVQERVGAEYQRLSDQYDLARSILNTLSSQLEQSRLAVMQNTPVFSVVEPVVMPHKKSSPKLSLHLISGISLGLLASISWLLIQLGWWQIFDEEKFRKVKARVEEHSNNKNN